MDFNKATISTVGRRHGLAKILILRKPNFISSQWTSGWVSKLFFCMTTGQNVEEAEILLYGPWENVVDHFLCQCYVEFVIEVWRPGSYFKINLQLRPSSDRDSDISICFLYKMNSVPR